MLMITIIYFFFKFLSLSFALIRQSITIIILYYIGTLERADKISTHDFMSLQ